MRARVRMVARSAREVYVVPYGGKGQVDNTSADELIWKYVEAFHHLAAPRPMNPVLETGLLFHKSCLSECTDGHPIERHTAKWGWLWMCSECSRGWRTDPLFLMKHEIQRSKRPGNPMDDQLFRMAHLATLLNRVPNPHRDIWIIHVLFSSSYRHTADLIRKRLHLKRSPWQVGRSVRYARRVVNAVRHSKR